MRNERQYSDGCPLTRMASGFSHQIFYDIFKVEKGQREVESAGAGLGLLIYTAGPVGGLLGST